MNNAKQITDDLIGKVKNLQLFTVTKVVPDNFAFYGKVPFDLQILGDRMIFKVYALNHKEADSQVEKYLEGGIML